MAQNSTHSYMSSPYPAPASGTLTGLFTTHQHSATCALAASAALASSTAAVMPGYGTRGVAAILRTLRSCTVLSAGSATQKRSIRALTATATTATSNAATPAVQPSRPYHSFTSSGSVAVSHGNATAAAAAAAGSSPAAIIRLGLESKIESLFSFGGVGGGGGGTLWGPVRRRLLQPLQPHHIPLRSSFGSCSSCSAAMATSPAVAASAAAAASAGAAAAGARRCFSVDGFALANRGRGLIGPAMQGLPRRPPYRVRRMSTQAAATTTTTTTSSSSSSSAGRAGGVLRGRVGDALRLQLAAAWHKYGTAMYVATALAAVVVLWRVMRSVTNTFIAVNDRMAEYGVMAVAASTVLLGALYLRWRTAIDPAAVYRKAMVQLNTHPGVLEVMGAPLVGSAVRAYVVTGGGLYLSKKFRIKLRSRRIQMMFPLSGPDRKGLVSLEAKRQQGRYVWKLLAVDLGPELQQALPAGGSTGLSAAPPPPSGLPGGLSPAPAPAPPEPPSYPRVYAVGDLAAYQRGGVLGELRSPFLKALSNSRSYEVEDELEDELDELNVPKSSYGDGAVGAAVRRALSLARAALLARPQPSAAAADDATSSAAIRDKELGPSLDSRGQNDTTSTNTSTSSTSSSTTTTTTSSSKTQSKAAETGSASASWWGRWRKVVSGPPALASAPGLQPDTK